MPMLSACGARTCPPFMRPDASFSRSAEKSARLHARAIRWPRPAGPRHPLQVAAEIVLARLDFREQARGFLRQRSRDHRQRQDHHGDNDQNGDRGREARPVLHRLQQPSIDRREQHRHDDRPENGAIERVQHPGERQRDGDKQQQETLMFDPLHDGLVFPAFGLGPVVVDQGRRKQETFAQLAAFALPMAHCTGTYFTRIWPTMPASRWPGIRHAYSNVPA